MPGAEEIRAHKLAHQPYRIWCRHCALGKAGDVRLSASGGARLYQMMSLDYMHLEAIREFQPCVCGSWWPHRVHNVVVGAFQRRIGKRCATNVHVVERDRPWRSYFEERSGTGGNRFPERYKGCQSQGVGSIVSHVVGQVIRGGGGTISHGVGKSADRGFQGEWCD